MSATQSERSGARPAPAKAAPKKAAKSRAVATTKGAQALVVHQPKTTLELIWMAARDKSVDVAKLRELLAIQKEQEDRQAEIAFSVAMLAAQKEMPAVYKDKQADRFKYPSYDNVQKTVRPVIEKHGFTLSWSNEPAAPGHVIVSCTCSHTAGHSRRYLSPEFPADTAGLSGKPNKTQTQGLNASGSTARRYLTMMIFNIVPEGEDRDGAAAAASQEPVVLISQKQADDLRDLMESLGVKSANFLAWAKVKKVEDIAVDIYESCLREIRRVGGVK